MPKILKKTSKTGDQFTAISDLHNNEERVLFQTGKRQLRREFSEQVYSPRYLKYCFLKGQGYFCFPIKNPWIAWKFNFFEIQLGYTERLFPILRYLGTINFLWKVLTELPTPSLKKNTLHIVSKI